MIRPTVLTWLFIIATIGFSQEFQASAYRTKFTSRDLGLYERGDIADLLDKNPNIKELVSDYSDLIGDLIKRERSGLQARDYEELAVAGFERRNAQELRLRSTLHRFAKAQAAAAAERHTQLEAESESEATSRAETRKLDGRGIGVDINQLLIVRGPKVILGHQAYEDKKRSASAEAVAEAEAETEAEANVLTNLFQGDVHNAKQNTRRNAEANVLTNLFGGSIDHAKSHSKRNAIHEPIFYESSANLFTRMFKTGSDLLSSISGITKRFQKRHQHRME